LEKIPIKKEVKEEKKENKDEKKTHQAERSPGAVKKIIAKPATTTSKDKPTSAHAATDKKANPKTKITAKNEGKTSAVKNDLKSVEISTGANGESNKTIDNDTKDGEINVEEET